jgi:lambda family phage portal protein
VASPARKVIPFPAAAERQWKSASLTGLTFDWGTTTRPIDADIRTALTAIRARARHLAQNSDHAKGFLRIVRNNVVGAEGYVLQSRAQTPRGKPDSRLREQVEAEWRAWCRRGVCEVSGRFSWRELQRHVIETVARDGEAFLRLVDVDNPWRLALQVIDPETIDTQYTGEYQGRAVRMGVEMDDYRRPIAYHLYGEPPVNQSSYRTGTDRYRLPASELLHIYLPEFAWQTRGVSWLAVAAWRLNMLTATEDAEVTAARASASKFAAYEAQEWAAPPQPAAPGLVDANGQPLTTDPGSFAQDIKEGSMEVVPYGYKLNLLDPQHPNGEMPAFLKWGLRSIATGTGVSYNTLGNDAEGVNYTSLRFFLGVERDLWRERQDWFEGELPQPVFDAWRANAVMLGRLTPRPNHPDELARVHWQPRRWEGPDPAKQAQADQQDLANGTTTLTEILARKGRDFDDHLAEKINELARIKQAAESAGLTLGELLPYLAASAAPTARAEDDPDAYPDD